MDGRPAPHSDHPLALAFSARVGTAADPRLAAAMTQLVGAFADIIDSTDATRADLRTVIGFLTDVGGACSEQRQEWVLLADAFGLTSLVETRMARRPAGATPNTMPGPFYRAGAPRRPEGASISIDGQGEPLLFAGQVTDVAGVPVAGAEIEVWQANGDGLYENQEPDRQPEFNLRGIYRSGADGEVTIRTVRPAGYPIPADGPVGQLLARMGIGLRRPAHLHFRVTAPGFQRLTTHVFDQDDPSIDADPLFAVHPALTTRFVPQSDGGLRASYKFVLTPAVQGDNDI